MASKFVKNACFGIHKIDKDRVNAELLTFGSSSPVTRW